MAYEKSGGMLWQPASSAPQTGGEYTPAPSTPQTSGVMPNQWTPQIADDSGMGGTGKPPELADDSNYGNWTPQIADDSGMGGAGTGGGTAPGGSGGGGAPASPYATIEDLYKGILGRAGEQAGIDYWGSKFGDTVDANEYQQFLAASKGEMSDNVDTLYNNSFGRDADTAGAQYWRDQIESGNFKSMDELNAAFLGGRKGQDESAYNDGAKYDTAWNSGLNADDAKLVYNAATDRWEINQGGSGGVGGGGGGNTYNADLNRQVDPKTMTIEGRINNILGRDANGNYTNPVIQQAAMRARQAFAGRGLLNSSMSEQAALEAVTAKAIEIAGPDAQTYFAQGRANQDATNVFARDEQNFKYDKDKMATAHGYDLEKLGVQQGYTEKNMGTANGYDLAKMAAANGYDLEKMKQAFGYDLDKMAAAYGYDLGKIDTQNSFTAQQNALDRQNRLDSINLQAANGDSSAGQANNWQTQRDKNQAVNSTYDTFLRQVDGILARDLDADAKLALLNQAAAVFNNFAEGNGSTMRAPTFTKAGLTGQPPGGGTSPGGTSPGGGSNPGGGTNPGGGDNGENFA